MPPKYDITVTAGSETLLKTSKSRYDQESSLVAALAQKLLDPSVLSVTFTKAADHHVDVAIELTHGDRDAARSVVYGPDFASESTQSSGSIS